MGRSAIANGCYPGRYLAVLGRLGYEVNGIDYCKQVEDMPAALKEMCCRVGAFWKTDFEHFSPERQFDVVASFGFLEHFDNFEDMVRKHAGLVCNGGYLVLEVPNFFGAFQHWLHANFDQQSYERHYSPAMDVENLARIVEREGFAVLYKGYFGDFDFWTEHQERTFLEKVLLTVHYRLRPALRRILARDNKTYSPFAAAIARRQGIRRHAPAESPEIG